ncbi:MAG: GNAT family N-acetyltransferase [Acutalibacteraceae bacterium]
MKGHGYSTDLLNAVHPGCQSAGKSGVCILCAEGPEAGISRRPEVSGLTRASGLADISDCGISLMYLPLVPNAEPPKFRDCARHPEADGDGFVAYYTDQCPFTCYWVPRVQESSEGTRHSGSKQSILPTGTLRRMSPRRSTLRALFRDGQFLTQSIQSDKKFLALAGVRD